MHLSCVSTKVSNFTVADLVTWQRWRQANIKCKRLPSVAIFLLTFSLQNWGLVSLFPGSSTDIRYFSFHITLPVEPWGAVWYVRVVWRGVSDGWPCRVWPTWRARGISSPRLAHSDHRSTAASPRHLAAGLETLGSASHPQNVPASEWHNIYFLAKCFVTTMGWCLQTEFG